MDDDFHIIVFEKSRCEGSRGATGLHDLFRKDIEELGSPDPDWFFKEPNDVYSVITDNVKKIPRCDELSSHSSSTTDEDGISSSVRNLIKLISKKSSAHSSRRTSCDDENGFESSNDDDKTFEADESWSSSMATPSKNHSILTEVNYSPAINLNLETSELQNVNTNSERGSPVGRLLCDDEDEESTETGFVFYGFQDPVAGSQRNYHNLEQGQSVYSSNHVSFPKCVDVDESACVLNFLIATMNASAEFKLDMPVGELSERLSFALPAFLSDDRDGGLSNSTTTECSSDKNIVSLNSKKIGVSCSIKGKDCVNVLQLKTEQLISQPKFSELPSVTENIGNTDETKISDTCAVVSSVTLKQSATCTTSSGIDILGVNKMEGSKVVGDAILNEDESSVVLLRQSKKISDAECNSAKSTDASEDKSNADFDRTRKCKEEPEYVTQILNLLCSPVNSSDSKSRKRKRIDNEESEVNKMSMKKEAECIVGELMDGLWEKIQCKLEEIEINSLVLSNIVVDVDQDAKESVKYCVNNPNDREYQNVISAFVGKNLEESSCLSLDKNLVANSNVDIYFQSEKEQLVNVCSSIEPLEERSLSQPLMNSNSDEQTTAMGASDEVMSNAAVLSSQKHTVSRTDATPVRISLLISPEGGNPVLDSSCSKLKGISSDPQPLIGRSAEIKIEPENEMESDLNYLGTQDFLSCSMLEEVCQASEALAYIGKVKNDCLMGQEHKSELKSPVGCSIVSGEKTKQENSCMSTGYNMGRKNVSQEEAIVNAWTNEPPIPRSSMSPYDEGKGDFGSPIKIGRLNPDAKGYRSHEEENSSIKSVKKKIMFSVPGCSELNENELGISDEVYNEVVMESYAHCESLPLKSSSCKQKNIVSISHEGLNRFVYPKQTSQKKILIPTGVLPEDLMSMASQLEKHSSLISNNGKSNLMKLKTGSLMSFSSLQPTECDLPIGMDSKTKSMSSESQPFLKNKKPMQVVQIDKTHREVEDNTFVFNDIERDADMVHIGKSTQLEKNVGLVQRAFTSEMMAELDSIDGNLLEGWEPLAKVDDCKRGVENLECEQNANIGSRDNICTSPILFKKLRRKKPFRRRKPNTLTPIAKKTLIEVIKGKTSKTMGGEKDSCTQSVKLNTCVNDESNSCNVTAEDKNVNDASEPGKIVDGNIGCLKETLTDLFVDVGNSEDIEHIKKNPHIKEVLIIKNTSKSGVDSEILPRCEEEVEISPGPNRNDNLPLSDKSTPVTSEGATFSTASGRLVAISEASLNKAKKLFAEDGDSLGDVGDLGISAASGETANDPVKSYLKGIVPSCEDETPGKGDFPGFSSASGKKVSISEKSLARAKKLFAEEDMVLGESGDLHLLKTSGKNADGLGKLLPKSKISLSNEATPLRSKGCGFATASGRKVAVSEASLNKAKKLFAEDGDSLGDVGDLGISAASGEAANHPVKSYLKGVVPSCEDETPGKGDFPGFASASGKKVSISEKSLARAKKLFAEEDKVLGEIGDLHLLKTSGKKADGLGKLLPKSKISLSNESTPLRAEGCGFATASGRKVAVSEASLNKAKKLFAEDGDSLGDVGDLGISAASGEAANHPVKSYLKGVVPSCEDETPGKGDFPGFASASGKKVSISEKSLARAKKLFAEEGKVLGESGDLHLLKTSGKNADGLGKLLPKSKISLSNESTPLRAEGCGFATASGSKVSVSEASLNKAKKLFAEDGDSLGDVGELGISAASGEAANDPVKSYLKGIVPSCEDETPGKGDFPGFASASGKKVSISEKSLARAKKLFAEEDKVLGEIGDLHLLKTSGKKADGLGKLLPKSKISLSNESTPLRAEGCGFATASGRKVAVSEASLNKAKKLFAEDGDSLGDVGDLGISAASGEAANHPVKSYLKGVVPSCEDETPGKGDFPGFASASGKKVSISEKSLARAKKLFAEEGKVLGESGDLHLLKTSGKNADGLGKLLPKSKISLSNESTPLRAEGCGFATASGRKVAVSEASLNKAKKLFAEDGDSLGDVGELGISAASGEAENDPVKSYLKGIVPSCEDETPEKGDFPGFASASGKKVSISEKSLARAKKLFAEEDKVLGESGDLHLLKTSGKKADGLGKLLPKSKISLSNESTPLRSEGCGFATASGSEVSVSEASLNKAKKLFAEDGDLFRDACDLGISSASGEAANDPVKSHLKGMVPSCEEETPGKGDFSVFSSASSKKVSMSEKSLIPLKKGFSEDLTINENTSSVHPFDSAVEMNLVYQCPLQKPEESYLPNNFAYCDSPNQVAINSQLSSNNGSGTLPINKIEVVSCIGRMNYVGSPESNHFCKDEQASDPGSQVSPCKSEPVLFIPNEQNVKLGHSKHVEAIQERCITPNQDVFFAESQGDDYIKAVDVAVLNSPSIPLMNQNPPSPVFKTMRKRRLKMKRTAMKRKAPVVLGTQRKLDSCASPQDELRNPLIVDGGLSKSSHSSNQTPDLGCCGEGKDSDLWGGDVADESWLSKQLELAEESNFEVKLGENVDHWAEGRKAQEELISSKANVRPLIGHCLQVRREMGQQCRSLRDFVKGKRPGRYTKDQLRKYGILEETLSVTSENAVNFQFKLQDYSEEFKSTEGLLVKDGFRLIPDKKGMFGVREAQSALLAGPGVDPNLLPVGNWCDNHYRWIVWKLASYEKSFPQEFGGRCLTPENLMCQLKYRWDREIDRGERSAIRKILEKDDTASKRMILCVSDIKKPAMPASSKKMELDLIASSSVLELTDGWYCINGMVDFELAHLIQSGRLTIGSKIITSGGELINGPPNGCSPLEPPASTARIRLSANSTRRARWDAKLGYFCRHPGPLPVSLHSLLPQGGAVGALSNVLLARVYPLLSIEKTLDGRKVVRGKRAEARAAAKYEFERQAWLESVYAEVSAEMQREQEEDARRQKGKRSAPDGGGNVRSFKRPKKSQSHSEYVGRVKDSILSHCGQTVEVEELSRLVDESGDPSEVQKLLTTSQVDMISAYRQESLERFQKELEDRVRQRIKQEEENLMSSDKNKDAACSLAGRKNRDVVTLLKVRLVDADQPVIAKSAVLTVWRPSEDVISLLGKEGTILNIYGLTANGVRSNFIQLSSGKHTRYKLKKSQAYTAHLMESTYSILRREILSQGFEDYKFNLGPGSKTSLPPFGEIDLVAIVIKVGAEPGKAKGQGFQYLYVAGSDASLLSIAFWGGIQEFAVEDFLHPGSVVAVLNLQWRRLHGLHKIATLQAVETSTFTLNPVEERLKKVMKDFMIEIKTEKQFQSNVAEFIKSCEQKLDAVLGADFKEVSSSSNKGSMSAESKLSPVSTLSVANSVENISPITPSVAARMKKLQMYEGFMEIPLPTYHLRKSASVEKAFHPPKKGLTPSTTSSHEIKVVETVPERCQSPRLFNSKEKIVNFSLSENKNVQSSDADSPPMSLDSDPQE